MNSSQQKKQKIFSWAVNLGAVILLYAVLLFLIGNGTLKRYEQGILMTICINIILAVSLNLTTGFLGQLALGHAGFMSVGAYTAALFSKSIPMADGPLKFLAALLLGGLMAAVFGILIGVPALRLKGDYLAIITLGLGEIIRVVIENLKFTGGAQGLRSIPKLAKLPMVFWITVCIVAVLFALIRSRHGRAIIAIREDEIAAEASGIHTTYYKIMAFTFAAFLAGIAGGIYAHYLGILGASTFDFNRSIEIVVIVVLGGMGSFTGSILAAVVLTLLPEALQRFSDYRMLLYSIALIGMMIFKPSGLLGTYEFSLTRLLRRIASPFTGRYSSGEGKREKLRQTEEAKG